MNTETVTPSSAEQAAAHLASAGILDAAAIVTTPTTDDLIATQAAEIADLKSKLEAQLLRGNNRPIELEDGEVLAVTEAQKRFDEFQVAAKLEILKSERYVAELAEMKPITTANTAPVLNRESAEKLFGRTGWEKLPNATKAQVLDTRQADIDRVRLEDVFGSRSDSRAAHELQRDRPGLYKLCRALAIKKGLIG
jgi:hypothetical protein